MRHISTYLAFVVALSVTLTGVQARQDHSHQGDALGTVHFETSCSAAVNAAFTRAVALLHSFGYEEARRAFEDVAARDERCAMAHWGIAMTWWHPLWAPPTKAELTSGQQAATRAKAIGGRTPRERAYIEAIGLFYDGADTTSHQVRAVAYRERMMRIVSEFKDDVEASIFYALSLLATASPGDASFANQKRAAEILNRISIDHPDHPGVAHYMIHAFDYPRLAQEALPAARAYAKIAPASPHALHMPTHIFTRLGLWQESITANLASARAARELVATAHPGATSFDGLHALDYLVYAYCRSTIRKRLAPLPMKRPPPGASTSPTSLPATRSRPFRRASRSSDTIGKRRRRTKPLLSTCPGSSSPMLPRSRTSRRP